MSIIITGLEMPMERESFNLTIKYNGMVFDTETGIQVAEAYELPPHGRLGDLDKVYKDALTQVSLAFASHNKEQAAMAVANVISNAPTIIPAEPLNEEVNE